MPGRIVLTLLASMAVTTAGSVRAIDSTPGAHDEEALRRLHTMVQALPLRTTTLQQIAPEFVVEKTDGLSWEQAVAEANQRFGEQQPARAMFLSKYLQKGSSEKELAELHLPVAGLSVGTGSGVSRGFVFGPTSEPTATMTVWLAQGKLVGEPQLALSEAKVAGVSYQSLTFDRTDHLVSATQKFPADAAGSVFQVQENTTGPGGTNYYSAVVIGPAGALESIGFTPELVLRDRRVSIPNKQSSHEVYENGVPHKRIP